MDSYINIVLASDNNYAQHLAVTATSILRNTAVKERVRFYILSDGIKRNNYALIEKTICDFGAHVVEVDCENCQDLQNLYTIGHISKATYLRLNLSKYLPNNLDKVIYLDVDLLVLDDIDKLWNVDLQGCIVGAVPDLAILCSKRMVRQKQQTIGTQPGCLYFNAGVLVIDFQQWIKYDISDLVIQEATTHQFRHQDQDALNKILKDCWKPIGLRWNVIPPVWAMQLKIYFSGYRAKAIEAHNNPAVFHYAGRYKPWEFVRKDGFNDLYYYYLSDTAFADVKMPKAGCDMRGKSLLRQMLRIKWGNWLCGGN